MSIFDDILDNLDNVYEGGKVIVPFIDDLNKSNKAESDKLNRKLAKYNRFLDGSRELMLTYQKLRPKEIELQYTMNKIFVSDKNLGIPTITKGLSYFLSSRLISSGLTYVIGRLVATWIVNQTVELAAMDAAGVAIATRQAALAAYASRMRLLATALPRVANVVALGLIVYDLWSNGKDFKEKAAEIKKQSNDINNNITELKQSMRQLLTDFGDMCDRYSQTDNVSSASAHFTKSGLKEKLTKFINGVDDDSVSEQIYSNNINELVEYAGIVLQVITSLQIDAQALLMQQDGDLQKAYHLLLKKVDYEIVRSTYSNIEKILSAINTPEVLNSGWNEISIQIQSDSSFKIVERKPIAYTRSESFGGDGGNEFIDDVGDKRLTGVVIRHDDIIDAIQGIYNGEKGTLHGNTSGDVESIISLENDEVITEIAVSTRYQEAFDSSMTISGICITTTKQTYPLYGKGEPTHKIPGPIYGFYGRAGKYVYCLGGLTLPTPKN